MSTKLDGKWRLYGFRPGEGPTGPEGWAAAAPAMEIEAEVPGNVELDMERSGVLPPLFQGDNIRRLADYEGWEWWYEGDFPTPNTSGTARRELVFHGVDTLATYWLNGKLLGNSRNMLIEHRFDVSGFLESNGVNRLLVRLESPITAAFLKSYEPSMQANHVGWESLWIRKAPHSYGWDIMPRAVTTGIWRSVELIERDPMEFADLYPYTVSLRDRRGTAAQSARLGLYYRMAASPSDLRGARIHVEGRCGASRFEADGPASFAAGRLEFDVVDPRLWWPRGYGEPALYDLVIRVERDGSTLCRTTSRMGIRTVELVRTEITTDDRPGEFLFRVNGEPVFCKGSNWVPADAFHSRDAGRYRRMLELFADLGCNMIRCWGGGVYEDHEFFSICDEQGMMVWQDFAMACARYPQSEEFQRQLDTEARKVVRKLRTHPSLVVWCGDNECDQLWERPQDNVLTRRTLAEAVRQCDPYRPYVPSSPYISPEAAERGERDLQPELHVWRPRDYYKSLSYATVRAHFIGEQGYHGCPSVSSMRRFLDKESLWPWRENEQWILHGSDPAGREGRWAYRSQLMADQVRELFGEEPDDLETFALASQICQGEAKKTFVEWSRVAKWRRTGILWWNVIDGWPQFSDAVVDYYFTKKLAYHYLKRSQQPVCVMIGELEAWYRPIVASNDTLEPISGSCVVRDADTGKPVWKGDFELDPNQNREIGRFKAYHSEQRLLLIEWRVREIPTRSDLRNAGANHYLAGAPPFDLERYRRWLPAIAALTPGGFDPDRVAV